MKLKGTKTEKNLLTSFAGESQARNRYTMAAKTAKKEGYAHIAAIFLETAGHEKEHAQRFFKLLKEGNSTEVIKVGEFIARPPPGSQLIPDPSVTVRFKGAPDPDKSSTVRPEPSWNR